MKPALTAEEWEIDGEGSFFGFGPDLRNGAQQGDAQLFHSDGFLTLCTEPERSRDIRLTQEEAHGVAALCLYDQPFGFTREDVRLLRQYAEVTHPDHHPVDRWGSLADRIEALLPLEPSDQERFMDPYDRPDSE